MESFWRVPSRARALVRAIKDMPLADLWAHLAGEWEDVDILEVCGGKLAIDGQCWIYECLRDAEREGNSRCFLTGFFNRCKRLMERKIIPFIVFDQYQDERFVVPQLSASGEVEARWIRECRPPKIGESIRRRFDRSHFNNDLIRRVLELLDCMGVRYHLSMAVDNEAAGSYLEDTETVVGFVSPDMEYFLYGGRNLYQLNFEENGMYMSNKVKRIRSEKLLETHGLNRYRLVALGMLLGCDYMEKKINGIGIVTALEIVSEFSVNEDDHPCTILDRFRSYCDHELASPRKNDSPVKKKLFSACYNLNGFNPNSDAFAEAVNAYMWPNLEKIPFETLPPLCAYNESKINELLHSSLPEDVSEKGSESIELSGESVKVERRSPRKRKSPSWGSLETCSSSSSSLSKKRSGRRRLGTVVTPCSPQEALAWSKREWQAIIALRNNTVAAFNQHTSTTTSKRRNSNASVLGIKRRALPAM